MFNLSLKHKTLLFFLVVCISFASVSTLVVTRFNDSSVKYQKISKESMPKAVLLGELLAKFRFIRIKVRSLALAGNTEKDYKKYLNEGTAAIGEFVKLKKEFMSKKFDAKGAKFNKEIIKGWEEFFAFGKELFKLYENPTEENLKEGARLVRDVCPVKAALLVSKIDEFIRHQEFLNASNLSEAQEIESWTKSFAFYSLTITILLSMISGFFFTTNISNKLILSTKKLFENVEKLDKSSSDIAQSSNELNSSSTEASSSLTQTVASLTQINNMVQRSTVIADSSSHDASGSVKIVEEGKKTIASMIGAMNDISSSNSTLSSEVERSNKDISQIINIMNDIQTKTNIINDIVFQTKLLSFNASVEAARAGEHGKGFSVVAEEIGSLAKVSGSAASEINEMLTDTNQKIESIIKDSSSSLNNILSMNKKDVESGISIANSCDKLFDEILGNIQNVEKSVAEISSASKEQANGVKEVNAAILELNEITDRNSRIADTSSALGGSLKSESEILSSTVSELLEIVSGSEKETKKAA